jgi:DNA-directed RNA polymerase subunit A"
MTERLSWKQRSQELPEKYENLSPEKKEDLLERYKGMQYEPGEAVGMVASQSLAEPATQLTMETYHQAGAAQVSLTKGLPRLEEIVDARRNPKTPTMIVKLLPEHDDEETAKEVARKLREVKIGELVKQESLDIMSLEATYHLNESLLEDYEITAEQVAEEIRNAGKASAETEGNKITFEYTGEDSDLKDLTELKKSVEDTRVKGIKGIEQVVVSEEEDGWTLNTAGTSLRKTLKIDEVDQTRTVSNDLFEVKRVLGIEALRKRIIEEINKTLSEQGIGADDRHIMLLADMMTREGELNGTTRYGIVGDKESVLARSAFEETKKHISDASLKGETDKLNGIVENLVTGQKIPAGTGKVDLRPDFGGDEQ